MDLEKQLNKRLASRLEVIKQEAEKIWQKGELNHVYYTLHGMNHSEVVVKILNDLIKGLDTKYKLEEMEIFCLLAAAYLHDVGMQYKIKDDEIKVKEISESKGQNYTVQDLIRDQHHKRSNQYIRENAEIFTLKSNESYIVGLIAEGHRKENLNSDKYDDKSIENSYIRVRLLSALLRLADELDICSSRAPEELYKLIENDMPEFSKLQWLKHYYTAGVVVDTYSEQNKRPSTFIKVEYRYPSEESKDKIVELISVPIEKIIEETKQFFLDFGLNVKLVIKETYDPYLKEIPEDLFNIYFRKSEKQQDELTGSNGDVSIHISFSSELPKIRGFIGRDRELKDLSNSLKSNIIIIEGIPGIGKTYVAAKFAESLKEKYTVFWYENLSSNTNLSSVINKISYFFKENGRPKLSNYLELFGSNDSDVLIKLFIDELNSGNFAIFFDDYHKSKKLLNPLFEQLTTLQSSKIIIITREEPNFYNVVDEREGRVYKVKINNWDLEQTTMMLKEREIKFTDSIVEEINSLLHGHPQYLNLFCILALNSSTEEILEKTSIARKDAHSYLEKEVYNSLTNEESVLLKTISVFRTYETIDAFSWINEFNDLSKTLSSLRNKFLVDEIRENTFKVHDIIRDYCLNKSALKEIKEFHKRASKYYLSSFDDPEHILEAINHLEQAGLKEEESSVIINNASNFISKGFWRETEQLLLNTINSFRRKTQPKHRLLLAVAHLKLGELYSYKEDYELTSQHANQCKIKLGNIGSERDYNALYDLYFSIHIHNKEYELAKECNEKCYKISESINDEVGKAVSIANRMLTVESEENEKKLDQFMKTLAIFKELDDIPNIETSYKNIANAYSKMGKYEASYEYMKKALSLQKERNAVYEIAETKNDMAKTYFIDPNKPINNDSIIECLKEVVETYKKIGHIRGEIEVLDFVGDIFTESSDFESAINYYKMALDLSISLNQKQKAAELYTKIGSQYYNLDKFELAINNYNQALNLCSATNETGALKQLLNSQMGNCFMKVKNYICAKDYFERNVNSTSDDTVDLMSLTEVNLILGNIEEAMKLSKKLITYNNLEEVKDIREVYLGHFFVALSSALLNRIEYYYQCLLKIGELDYEDISIDWDFSDILPVLKNTGKYQPVFEGIIKLFQRRIKYPIIKPEDVEIVPEQKGIKSQVFHHFTGWITISVDDTDLKQFFINIGKCKTINTDIKEIMGIERSKALLILGFLTQKKVYNYYKIDDSSYCVKITDIGHRYLTTFEHMQVKT